MKHLTFFTFILLLFSCNDEIIEENELYQQIITQETHLESIQIYNNLEHIQKVKFWDQKFNHFQQVADLNENQTIALSLVTDLMYENLYLFENPGLETEIQRLEEQILKIVEDYFTYDEITVLFYKIKEPILKSNSESINASAAECDCRRSRNCTVLTHIGPDGIDIEYHNCESQDNCGGGCGFLGLQNCKGACDFS